MRAALIRTIGVLVFGILSGVTVARYFFSAQHGSLVLQNSIQKDQLASDPVNGLIGTFALGSIDFTQAVARIHELPIEKRDAAILAWLTELKKIAPSEIALLPSLIRFNELRSETQLQCLSVLLEFAPMSIEPWIVEIPAQIRVALLNDAFRKVIGNSMNSGVYLRCVEPQNFIKENAEKALAHLAQSDPNEAIRLARLASAEFRDDLLMEVSLALIQGERHSDPDALASTIRELTPSAQGGAAARLAGAVSSDLVDCLAMLTKLPEAVQKSATLELLKWENFAVKQRRVAMSRWIQSGGSLNGLKDSLGEIARQTSYESVSEAVAFVTSIHDEKLRSELKRGLIHDIGQFNPTALIELSASMTTSDERDYLQSEVALNFTDNAKAAIDAALTIASPLRRQQVLTTLGEHWKNVTPNEFEQVLSARLGKVSGEDSPR
jgi:hypothetical protein